MILIKIILFSFILLLSFTQLELSQEVIHSDEFAQGDPISRTERNVKLDETNRIGKILLI